MKMRMPWVSRAFLEQEQRYAAELRERFDAAIDAMEEERDWLRGRIEYLEEMLERRNRFESGMPELPRQERPRLERMPDDLKKFINRYENPSLKRQMLTEALRRHSQGEGWETIRADVMSEAGSASGNGHG